MIKGETTMGGANEQNYEAIVVPTEDYTQEDMKGMSACMCIAPTREEQEEPEEMKLDPKNYKFKPACFTNRIRPAGRNTFKSDNLYNVLTGQY